MSIHTLKLLLCCGLVLLLSGCLRNLIPFTEQTDYRLTGIEKNTELKDYLQSILDDRLAESIVADNADIRAREEEYREQTIRVDLAKALKAKGFYEGKVTYKDNPEELSGTYRIDSGPRYRIASVAVEPPAFNDISLPLKAGDPLEAEKVLDAQKSLLRMLKKGKCLFSLEVGNKVVLDKTANSAALTLVVNAGPEVIFGETVFTDATNVNDSYLQKLIPWQEGDCFDRAKLEDLRARLLETGLFSRTEIILPDQPAAGSAVPVTVRLKERAPRTVRVGASYYTDEGLGGILEWEHRNLFGNAEDLVTSLQLSQLRYSLDATLTKPYFLRDDQSLSLSASLTQEDTDAYDKTGLKLGASLSRTLSDDLSATLGVNYALQDIDDGESRTFGLLSTPGSLSYDSRDNILNPKEGWVLTGTLTPFFDTLGESEPFVKTELGGSTYWNFGEDTVLAARAQIGSISGAKREDIPATERFYAGGGGSVRGFGYQEVGPTEDGVPQGGRSIITTSLELRFKATETMGGVVFVDGGSVSDEPYPQADSFAIGAGAGFRYFTGFGPIRFDVGVPLNQKDKTDSNYQIYISIGQAF